MDPLNTLSLEARRVYCMFMRRYLLKAKGQPSNYGSQVLPHYDGTTAERPRPGQAVLHRSGKDFKPVWPKIAKCAQTNKLSVLELIRSQFDTSISGAPGAQACHSSRAAAMAVRRRDPERQETFNTLNSYRSVMDLEISKNMPYLKTGEAFIDVILASNTSAIFKLNTVLLIDDTTHKDALGPGLVDLLKPAVEEYLLKPDVYEAVWSKFIHPLFREMASRFLQTERSYLFIRTNDLIL